MRIASLAGIGLALLVASVGAAGCSKSDPVPTGTAPPRDHGPGAVAARGGAAEGAVAKPAVGAADGANDTSFQLAIQQPAPTTAGSDSVARVTVSPGPGYKMNLDFPTKLTVDPPAGVTVRKPVMEPADAASFTEQGLKFEVIMRTPDEPGEFTVPATLKFAVCTDATCDPKKQKVALVLKTN